MLPSGDKVYEDDDFILQQDLAPALTATGTKSCLSDQGASVPESMAYCQEEEEKQQMTWRLLSKQLQLPLHLSRVTGLSPPCFIYAVIHAKEAQPPHWGTECIEINIIFTLFKCNEIL